MTATQIKRIRRNLAQSATLTAAAFAAARNGHADDEMLRLTARAVVNARESLQALEEWDEKFRAAAEKITRELSV